MVLLGDCISGVPHTVPAAPTDAFPGVHQVFLESGSGCGPLPRTVSDFPLDMGSAGQIFKINIAVAPTSSTEHKDLRVTLKVSHGSHFITGPTSYGSHIVAAPTMLCQNSKMPTSS